jgi:hypothetical protein
MDGWRSDWWNWYSSSHIQSHHFCKVPRTMGGIWYWKISIFRNYFFRKFTAKICILWSRRRHISRQLGYGILTLIALCTFRSLCRVAEKKQTNTNTTRIQSNFLPRYYHQSYCLLSVCLRGWASAAPHKCKPKKKQQFGSGQECLRDESKYILVIYIYTIYVYIIN